MKRLFLLVPLLLAGCASEGVGPSLARRPIEDRDLSEPVRQVAPPAPADAALKAQIDGLVTRAQTGQRAFAALLPKVETAAASAGTEGSESWVAAQQLLSALESERAPSTSALSELDTLIAMRLKDGNDAGQTELQAADRQIEALVQAQQSDIDRLRARIPG